MFIVICEGKLTTQQIIDIHDEELANSDGLYGIKEPGYLELISDKHLVI
jgi:hypothetical protein